MIVVHHEAIRRRIKPAYTVGEVRDLRALLDKQGTLTFSPLPTGLYPAAGIDSLAATHSGYGNVWVRDNIYIALALEADGHREAATTVANTLAAFYRKYRGRFEAIVERRIDPQEPMNRPQVRFNGLHLVEISTHWAHAQNDALGYFLWLYCRLARAGHLAPDQELLALFTLYFEAIRYWEDEDSGHWEERRKVAASSIGAVVAGLRALQELLAMSKTTSCRFRDHVVTPDTLGALITVGEQTLAATLPAECVQADPHKSRRYDAALLFLVYPLDAVGDAMERRLVDEMLAHLQGDYGIRRYLGDSYWTADYKDKLPPEARTADVSTHQEKRDALARPGEEAQWCIFDPIVSVIFGRRYHRISDPADLERQVYHLNRALGQLTGPDCPHGDMRCPEAYYLERGRYVPNDHVPLYWTQANLLLALVAMEHSAGHSRQ